MSVRVLAPGLLTTLQDGGRIGFRHFGVGTAGALDAYSHAVANLLVGNAPGAPVLEITLNGPRLHFDRAARIALCGADVDARATAGSDTRSLPGWRRVDLPAGSELTLGACRRGARAYLAVAGGFAAPCILGSGSTDLRAGFGGMRGRALAAGDVLPVARASTPERDTIAIAPWWIDPVPDLDFNTTAVVRVLPGRDAHVHDTLYASAWRIDAASNRQGLRLHGETLALLDARERISEPVAPGTIQLPADGQPIVLLADAQTHGGYARIGHVIAADRPRLAQLRAGDGLRFEPCTPDAARRLANEQQQRLARIAMAVAARA